MYRYDEFDHRLVAERIAQFRRQVKRRLAGEITEDQFKPLRLKNGVYLQLHAYMLRVNVPYGTLSSQQLRKFAHVARTYDRGFGHFTTRQNIQFNWIRLEQVPDILEELASVEITTIQSSGNCVRNITSDQYAGVARDELADPRLYCELLRQYSVLHPEFSYLPRKFKIAVTGSPNDRAAVAVHDIGLRMHRNDAGEIGFEVLVGGGLGRTPYIAHTIRDWVAPQDLLMYVESVLRIYNIYGRRDNIHKARIKIIVNQLGIDRYRELVEQDFAEAKAGVTRLEVPQEEIERIAGYFAPPDYEPLDDIDAELEKLAAADARFGRWLEHNVAPHKQPGYAIVTLSLKPTGAPPGDATAEQMDAIADLADRYSFSEIRVGHEQNLVLPHVAQRDLLELWQKLDALELATPNVGLVSDIIACPGLDYCSLANARSIPVAQELTERFRDHKLARTIGRLHINISGCINACGHHHVGHIGILGVEKNGEEFYQITLGGRADEGAQLGTLLGPAVRYGEVADVVEDVVAAYVELRNAPEELFIDTVKRLGVEPFKERVYAAR